MMSCWFVKELANITGISVQTLHHYDHIGLLKPAYRSAKGYRLYNEADLYKLQQIVALKFFGFELKQIKNLLTGDVGMRDHLVAQASFLDAKAKALLNTRELLKKVIYDLDHSSAPSWHSILNLIEVYRMTEKLENAWVKEFLNPEELKQYAKFESDLKIRFNESEKEQFHRDWASLISEIENQLSDDPASRSSQALAQRVMVLVDKLYGDEHADLRAVIWDRGFKGGFAPKNSMSKEAISWLDRALYVYYSQRILTMLREEDLESNDEKWQSLMAEIFLGNHELELDAVSKLLMDPEVSHKKKCWLKAKYGVGK